MCYWLRSSGFSLALLVKLEGTRYTILVITQHAKLSEARSTLRVKVVVSQSAGQTDRMERNAFDDDDLWVGGDAQTAVVIGAAMLLLFFFFTYPLRLV